MARAINPCARNISAGGQQVGHAKLGHFRRHDPRAIQCAEIHQHGQEPVIIARRGCQSAAARWEGEVLLGRQSRFPPGNYSALAGFLEPGESMEEAVRREIHEEAGITCAAVRYILSQPWPFGGSQLMMACIAQAQGDAITLDTNELEDAMWVTKEEACAALSGDEDRRFNAPPRFAIAHTLLKIWAQEG